MTKTFLLFCTAVLFTGPSLRGEDSPKGASSDAYSAALRELKIPNGTISMVQRDESPTLTAPDGKTLGNLPPRTIVKLQLRPARGSSINVEIWLPDAKNWNARFLGLGNGGAAGRINPTSLAGPLAGGYAVATTDMGTAPNPDSGVRNPEVWKDFGFRATHLMTLAAKQVIAAFYGKGPEYSYFTGGSTGGQQALQEAQRYPEDYDGIIAAGNEYMASREAPPVAGKFVSDPRGDSRDIEAVIALARQIVPYHATLDYYDRVVEHFGSLENVQAFFRFYLVPGMGHGGGPGINQPPNLLTVMRDWREKGVVPNILPGRRMVDGKIELEMPLHPYPAKTGWDAAASGFRQVNGPQGGVERVAAEFRPAARE